MAPGVSCLCARMSPSIRSDGFRGVEVLMLFISDSSFSVCFVLFKQGLFDAPQHLFGIQFSIGKRKGAAPAADRFRFSMFLVGFAKPATTNQRHKPFPEDYRIQRKDS